MYTQRSYNKSQYNSTYTIPKKTAFNPNFISGLALNLDPRFGLYQEITNPTTPATVAGDPVGTWISKTGQVFVATNLSFRPTLQFTDTQQPFLAFDGVDDFLTSSQATPFIGNSASLFARFNYSSLPTSDRAAVFGQLNDQITLYTDTSVSALSGIIRDSAGTYRTANTTVPSTAVWYSGGTIADGANSAVRVYRDTLTQSSGTTGTLLSSSNPIQIGAASGGSLYHMNGQIASVVGYNKALSASEVSRLEEYLTSLAQ